MNDTELALVKKLVTALQFVQQSGASSARSAKPFDTVMIVRTAYDQVLQALAEHKRVAPKLKAEEGGGE